MFRFLSLTILAWLIFRWLDRFFGGRGGSNRNSSGQRKNEPKGKRPSSSKVPKDVGEYVDYVEVKENKKEE
ncbi:MAG: hypothetical protein CL854_00860 [Cryomorphaceae bacterium]|jgi:hypothetical protein|nr:hypothetical protein [Cryomorphaceae bacterium]MDG1534798.1 hypothetical protein [Schleiferiaceae bacterium]MDG1903626.1 hypothetical protein [Schleiferiaceae bacterium]